MYEIMRTYLPIRRNVRPGLPLKTTFFVAHDIGFGGSTAKQNYQYFSRQTDRSASAHVFIDDQEIREIIPTGTDPTPPEKAWHVRYNTRIDQARFGIAANDGAIGVELCWGKKINFHEAYARYTWYFAHLCTRYNKNPLTDIVGHFHLDPERKRDPLSAFQTYHLSWEQFLQDVKNKKEDKPMYTPSQWQMIEDALLQQQKLGRLTDETWIKKVKSRQITSHELIFLNLIILNRMSQTSLK